MDPASRCPKCGTELAGDGSCPVCMLQLGLSGAVPPLPEPSLEPRRAPERRLSRFIRSGWLAGLAAALALAAVAAFFALDSEPPRVARVVRFSIPPPGGEFAEGGFALSPDGTRLAYTAAVEGGETLLWIQAFDAPAPRQLPGTEGATQPFWSPDSRYVGFFAQGKLRRIDAGGGPSRSLCDVPGGAPFGAAWSPQGVILFGNRAGGLMTVSAGGGMPARVTRLDETRHERSHRFPVFLPDGRHFLYSTSAVRPEDAGVFAGSLDSPGDQRLLLPGIRTATYGAGYLLFLRDKTLVAQPLDPDRLQISGEPQPVRFADSVEAGRNGQLPFSAASEDVLVYRNSGAPARLVWFDREGRIRGTLGEPGEFAAFALSPDGKAVAVSRAASDGGPASLWVHDLTRGTSSRLTFGPQGTDSPLWSPDAGHIVFRMEPGVFQIPPNGSGKEEMLLQLQGEATLDSWSRDGRFILYTAEDGRGKSAIWQLPVSGDRKPASVLSGAFNFKHGHVSPDLRWLAYVSDESGREEVYVQALAQGSGKWLISVNGGANPSWSPDGREIFYLSPDHVLHAVRVDAAPVFRAGIPRPLFRTEHGGPYAVSADGSFLVSMPVGESPPPPIQAVLNWTVELRSR